MPLIHESASAITHALRIKDEFSASTNHSTITARVIRADEEFMILEFVDHIFGLAATKQVQS